MSVESARGKGSADGSNDADDKEFSRVSCEYCGDDFYDKSGLNGHIETQHPEKAPYDCPSCDRSFTSRRGMRSHHTQIHNGSLRKVEFECEVCGEMGTKEPHHYNEDSPNYCSHDCISKDLREEKVITCKNCGETESFSPPSDAGDFCGEECANEYFKGRTHPQFKEDSHRNYGPNWDQQAAKARRRDNYECQICGKSQDDHPMALHVHHLKPRKEFIDESGYDYKQANRLDNLISLCNSCHGKYGHWVVLPLH